MSIDPPIIVPPSEPPPKKPDPQTEKAKDELTDDELRQILTFRTKFWRVASWTAWVWVGFIVAITFAQFFFRGQNYGLTEKEFIAVVVTTTGSTLGLAFVVGKFLFPASGAGQPRRE